MSVGYVAKTRLVAGFPILARCSATTAVTSSELSLEEALAASSTPHWAG
jgi:hypothetical protein